MKFITLSQFWYCEVDDKVMVVYHNRYQRRAEADAGRVYRLASHNSGGRLPLLIASHWLVGV